MTTEWIIPRPVLDDTLRAFRRGRHEVFVLWTAALDQPGPTVEVRRCVTPEQKPGITALGVFVHIEGKELARIAFDNFSRQERAVVQLHTHPGDDVEMSRLDREWEVVRHVGALSVIVPHYGARGLNRFPGVNVYEREPSDWRLWDPREVATRLRISP